MRAAFLVPITPEKKQQIAERCDEIDHAIGCARDSDTGMALIVLGLLVWRLSGLERSQADSLYEQIARAVLPKEN